MRFDAKMGYKEAISVINTREFQTSGYLLFHVFRFLVATFKDKRSRMQETEYITALYMIAIIPLLAGVFEDSFSYIPYT